MPSRLSTINRRGRNFQASSKVLFGMALITLSLVLATVFSTGLLLNYDNYERRCHNLLHHGRWSFADDSVHDARWQPYGSMLQSYDQQLTHACLDNRTLYFIGDSTIRQVFWATAVKLAGDGAYRASAEAGKHEDLTYQNEATGLEFVWDPYLNSSRATSLLNLSQVDPQRAAVLISSGLWHARYGGEQFMSEYKEMLRRALHNVPSKNDDSSSQQGNELWLDQTPVIGVPPPHLNHDWLNPERAATLTKSRLSYITSELAAVEASSGLEIAWAAREMTNGRPATILEGGLHVTRVVAAHQAELLLNRLCNIQFRGTNTAYSRPCVPKDHTRRSWRQVIGSVLVVYESYRQVSHNHSWHRLRASISVLTIVLFCWLADRTLVCEKTDKLISEKLFTFAALASIILGLVRVKRIPEQNVLPQTKNANRDDTPEILSQPQTEEWKGWMQVVILLYHYFGMSKVLWAYQTVRVLVASYLFLTGYGHATYFQRTGEFSLKRVVMVLLRLNLLTCLLTICMNNDYDFYYFPALASFWFLVSFATFWAPNGRRASSKELVLRVLVSMCAVRMMLHWESLLSSTFRGMGLAYGPNVDPKEFVFRVKLDMFAPYLGMLISVALYQNMSSYISWSSSLRLQQILRAITVLAAYFLFIVYILIARQFSNKFTYNEYHSLLSILPIAAYIMLRNVRQELRRHYASVFASIGNVSLELFVLQYHIWLAADTKGLLRLGWIDTPRLAPAGKSVAGSWTFWVESAIITVVFFWVSSHCAHATNTLVKWFVAAENRILLIRTGMALGLLWMFNVLAYIDGR
ncbi:hypothetical protein LTR70_008241 [Exophiala xenobiotica]|uniref:Cas1p 10 TM acyl transferase domain-containing protein n=1 Tax=Lithohypha guttulata TaxID=1690604 RepID=A0ABR0K2B1_9EURO|nr:hypothetical protein LTR24_007694 [Lithohypha guttulata]KAK5312318.1 hypothetical protein LTR70_008241 [Exophiala xenobiotica]